jgi:alcohol dehydrogenase class IV
MTPVYGITEGTEKKTGRDERVRPVLVVYDAELSRGLTRDVTMTSLWNAMAHAVKALGHVRIGLASDAARPRSRG